MNLKNEIYELIARKLSGEITDDEIAEFDYWLKSNENNSKLYKKFENIWNQFDAYGADFEPDISKAILRYKKRVENAKKLRVNKVKRLRVMQIAAAILILFSFSILYKSLFNSNELVVVTTDSLETKQIVLPDSSRVYLNRNTSVAYQKEFETRELKLIGEAFFEVEKMKGKSFIVKTENTKIKVLGTSFNIKAKPGKITTQVAVLTGKVEFSSEKTQDKVVIAPNQQATYKSDFSKIETSEFTNKNFLAWKTGILRFDNSSLKEVLETLSYTYDIEFKILDTSLEKLALTCKFNNQEIEDILIEIEILLPIKINTDGKLKIIEAVQK